MKSSGYVVFIFFIFLILPAGCSKFPLPLKSEAPKPLTANPKAEGPLEGLKIKARGSPLKGPLLFPPQKMRPGQGTIKLKIHLPAGYKLTPDAPSHWEIKSAAEKNIKPLVSEISLNADSLADGTVIPVGVFSGKAAILFDGAIYFCTADAKTCYFKNLKLEVPLEASPSANPTLELSVEVPRPSARPTLSAFQS